MLDPSTYKSMEIDHRDNGVVVCTLNRPERLNAVDGWMHTEMTRISREVDADRDAKVLVVTGSGRAFCAGGDFGGGAALGTTGAPMMQEARQIVDHLLECSKPVISAVNGYAMGLGATFALLADIVVAAKSAVFADTHVNMGIGAGDGGAVIWPLLMGVNRAKYHLMTGDRITGEEAERMGLANFVVEDDELMNKAMEIADRLAAGPGVAISASKVPINQYIRMVSNLVLPISLSMEGESMRSKDHKEAVKAFQEKRPPEFTGK